MPAVIKPNVKVIKYYKKSSGMIDLKDNIGKVIFTGTIEQAEDFLLLKPKPPKARAYVNFKQINDYSFAELRYLYNTKTLISDKMRLFQEWKAFKRSLKRLPMMKSFFNYLCPKLPR